MELIKHILWPLTFHRNQQSVYNKLFDKLLLHYCQKIFLVCEVALMQSRQLRWHAAVLVPRVLFNLSLNLACGPAERDFDVMGYTH
jgi:hypothetical protein